MATNPVDTALFFQDRHQWRSWLKQNHNSCTGVWLLHHKKHAGKKSISHGDAVEEALCFGWIDSTLRRIDEDTFILRFTPRKLKSVWSKINKEKAVQMIAQGKMTQAGQDAIATAKKHGLWDTAYTNKKRERLPSDLKQALLKNAAAWEHFNGFANSYRNMYIGWVQSAKTHETRLRRINEVVNRSALNKKPGIS